MPTRRGFAAIPKAQHKKFSSKGGRAKVSKGFASLSPADRIAIARKGSSAMWEKRRREAGQRETINSAEDGRSNESITEEFTVGDEPSGNPNGDNNTGNNLPESSTQKQELSEEEK